MSIKRVLSLIVKELLGLLKAVGCLLGYILAVALLLVAGVVTVLWACLWVFPPIVGPIVVPLFLLGNTYWDLFQEYPPWYAYMIFTTILNIPGIYLSNTFYEMKPDHKKSNTGSYILDFALNRPLVFFQILIFIFVTIGLAYIGHYDVDLLPDAFYRGG